MYDGSRAMPVPASARDLIKTLEKFAR